MKNKCLLICLFLILISTIGFSQNSERLPDILLISSDFSTNTNTFGVTSADIKQPNLITSVNYIFGKGLDFGYTKILTANSDSTYSKVTAEHDVFLGYTFEFGEKWSIYPNYTHMFHGKRAYTLASGFSDVFQNDIVYFGNNYNSSLSACFIKGDKNMFYASLQNAIGINFNNFIIDESILNIQLGVFINFSDNNYYNLYLFNGFDATDYIKWTESNLPLLSSRIENSIENYGLEITRLRFDDLILTNKSELFNSTDYRITSMDLNVPVFYSINNLMINFNPVLNIPLTSNSFYDTSASFYLGFGLSYSFTFKRKGKKTNPA